MKSVARSSLRYNKSTSASLYFFTSVNVCGHGDNKCKHPWYITLSSKSRQFFFFFNKLNELDVTICASSTTSIRTRRMIMSMSCDCHKSAVHFEGRTSLKSVVKNIFCSWWARAVNNLHCRYCLSAPSCPFIDFWREIVPIVRWHATIWPWTSGENNSFTIIEIFTLPCFILIWNYIVLMRKEHFYRGFLKNSSCSAPACSFLKKSGLTYHDVHQLIAKDSQGLLCSCYVLCVRRWLQRPIRTRK